MFCIRHHISRRSLKLSIFMNKSNSSYIITKLIGNVYWKGVIRKVNKSFSETLFTTTTNIAKDLFSTLREVIHRKKHLVVKKCCHCKNQFEF